MFRLIQPPKILTSLILSTIFVIPTSELHKQVRDAVQERQSNLAKVQSFFSSELAGKTLKNAKLDPAQVQKAVPFLSDEELANLAAKTDTLQKDFAAGALTNQQITYILIALATAVIILVIIEA
jgi:ABC-type multidrug transport system fused ATPase/permease subunit